MSQHMADRQFYYKHNVVVGIDLNAQGTAQFRSMLEFLLRSRIFHALMHSLVIRIEYLRQFWATAHLDCEPNPSVIRAKVTEIDITFSRDDLRQILQLGTAEEEDGPTEFPYDFRAGGFQRMGYSSDITKNLYTKSFLYGQWRYLSHVLLVSFAPKKGGFDQMGAKLQ